MYVFSVSFMGIAKQDKSKGMRLSLSLLWSRETCSEFILPGFRVVHMHWFCGHTGDDNIIIKELAVLNE